MIILKSYCYSEQELDFVIAQLKESYNFVDKYILYEFDVTHRGKFKPFRFNDLIEKIPTELRRKFEYRPTSISHLTVETDDPIVCHEINEKIQRSYFLNDKKNKFKITDIIIEVDVDEIIYARFYPILLFFAKFLWIPFSIRLNQFFYKKNYLWKSNKFKSPVIYRYGALLQKKENIFNSFMISNNRDYPIYVPWPCGAHFSWVMSPEKMVRKLKSYAHAEYEHFADENVLRQAIIEKKYIFDDTVKFDIEELNYSDNRIPHYLQGRDSDLD